MWYLEQFLNGMILNISLFEHQQCVTDGYPPSLQTNAKVLMVKSQSVETMTGRVLKGETFWHVANVKLMISVLPTFKSSSYGNDSYMCVIATYDWKPSERDFLVFVYNPCDISPILFKHQQYWCRGCNVCVIFIEAISFVKQIASFMISLE